MDTLPQKSSPEGKTPTRLDVLHGYGILDTPHEAEYDEITRLIARLCETPIASISLFDANREWFKSEVGLDVQETPLKDSIGAEMMRQRQMLVVPDLREDERFAAHPLVASPEGFRFYAGAPLVSPEGETLGTLAVLDRKPRQLTDDQLSALGLLARQTMIMLELRRKSVWLDQVRLKEEKTSRSRDHFLDLLSHELRTPLTPALLSASMLAGDSSLDPTQREAVDIIERSVKLQARLVDDLLDFTRMDQKRLRLVLRPVDLRDLVKEVVGSLERQPDMPTIKTACPAKRTFVDGDAGRLKQVFRNILHNAIKFTSANGSIVVEISDLSADTVRVSFADTGIGISSARLPRIFEPFEQRNGYPTTKRVAGLGLGLAIARGLVEMHQGTIAASSGGREAGTTITVDLPSLEKAPPAPEITTSAQPSLSPVSLRILLVEDQGATAVSLTRLLFRAGHKVLIADSIAAARNIADRESFDVLVSDIGLPDGSGYDLMKAYRGRAFSHGIALSGHGSDEDRAASLEAGFSVHLTKPVEYSDVEAALTSVAAQIFEASKQPWKSH